MIAFTCTCGHDYKVAEQHAGKKTKCKKCGTALIVPQSASMNSATPSQKSRPNTTASTIQCESCDQCVEKKSTFELDGKRLCKDCYFTTPTRSVGSSNVQWVLIGVGFIALVGLGIWFLTSGNEDKPNSTPVARTPPLPSTQPQFAGKQGLFWKSTQLAKAEFQNAKEKPKPWQTNFYRFQDRFTRDAFDRLVMEASPENDTKPHIQKRIKEFADACKEIRGKVIWDDLCFDGMDVVDGHTTVKFDMRTHGFIDKFEGGMSPFRILFRPMSHSVQAWKNTTPGEMVSLTGSIEGVYFDRQPTGHRAVIILSHVARLRDGYPLLNDPIPVMVSTTSKPPMTRTDIASTPPNTNTPNEPLWLTGKGASTVIQFKVPHFPELKKDHWPAFYIYLARAKDSQQLDEKMMRSLPLMGVNYHTVITAKSILNFKKVRYPAGDLRGYLIWIYDTKRSTVKPGETLSIALRQFQSLQERDPRIPGRTTPAFQLPALGQDVNVYGVLAEFQTEGGNFVFQQFLSKVVETSMKP